MAIKTYQKGSTQNLSENFTVKEFCCKGSGCCSTVMIDDKLVEILQNIRTHFGAPVTINSGYRCSTHNTRVGGASSSLHTKGQAADISVKGVAPAEVAKYAESIGVLGIGLYETNKDGHFVHIDTRTYKSFWYGQAEAYRSTFGGAVSKGNETVKEWQKAAIADGYSLPSGADGIWGKECEAVAKKALCQKPKSNEKYANINLTKIIQKAAGFTGKDVDGLFGSKTAEAVEELQKSLGFTGKDVDRIVGYNTWKKILGV